MAGLSISNSWVILVIFIDGSDMIDVVIVVIAFTVGRKEENKEGNKEIRKEEWVSKRDSKGKDVCM